MGNVIQLPKKVNEADAKILHMQSCVRLNILDMTEHRKRLIEMQKEIRKLKAKLTLRLVENDSDGKTS